MSHNRGLLEHYRYPPGSKPWNLWIVLQSDSKIIFNLELGLNQNGYIIARIHLQWKIVKNSMSNDFEN